MQHIAGATAAPDRAYDADVVILALDRAEETARRSARRSPSRASTRHVFVVDQGSRPENLARLAAAVAGRTDATLVRLDRNHGVAGGRNRGTRARAWAGHRRARQRRRVRRCATRSPAPSPRWTPTRGLAALAFRIVVFADGQRRSVLLGLSDEPAAARGRSASTTVTFVGAGHAIRRAAWERCRRL